MASTWRRLARPLSPQTVSSLLTHHPRAKETRERERTPVSSTHGCQEEGWRRSLSSSHCPNLIHVPLPPQDTGFIPSNLIPFHAVSRRERRRTHGHPGACSEQCNHVDRVKGEEEGQNCRFVWFLSHQLDGYYILMLLVSCSKLPHF